MLLAEVFCATCPLDGDQANCARIALTTCNSKLESYKPMSFLFEIMKNLRSATAMLFSAVTGSTKLRFDASAGLGRVHREDT